MCCDSDLDIGAFVSRENVHHEIVYTNNNKVVKDCKVQIRVSIFKVKEYKNEELRKEFIASLKELHLSNDLEI